MRCESLDEAGALARRLRGARVRVQGAMRARLRALDAHVPAAQHWRLVLGGGDAALGRWAAAKCGVAEGGEVSWEGQVSPREGEAALTVQVEVRKHTPPQPNTPTPSTPPAPDPQP